MPKETGILMSGPMIKAYIAGNKSQTRRTRGLEKINIEPGDWEIQMVPAGSNKDTWVFRNKITGHCEIIKSPYGGQGDKLWFRETFWEYGHWRVIRGDYEQDDSWIRMISEPIIFAAEHPHKPNKISSFTENIWRKKPGIHLFRQDVRFNPPIVSIRPERVGEITFDDAIKEGIKKEYLPTDPDGFHPPGSYGFVYSSDPTETIKHEPQDAFKELWDSINLKRGHPYSRNDWVFVLEFPKYDKPVNNQK